MKKILLSILIIMLITVTGCSKKDDSSVGNNKSEKNRVVKTKLSCYQEWSLFHSKKSIEHVIYLDQDNVLMDYERTEKYFQFDKEDEFNMICDGSAEEAELDNKLYDFKVQTANCDRSRGEVTILDKYDISKLTAKTKLPDEVLRDFLDDNYKLDISAFKTTIMNKGYVCVHDQM